ncbi:MAG: hypothetical protein FJ264_17045 [Planctomycetes bacterium]|nr:hypothetical protein [Planctomycetota bacterium]
MNNDLGQILFYFFIDFCKKWFITIKMKKMEIWNIGGVEYTSVSQIAKIVGVSPPAVYRWIYIGMPAYRSEVGTYLIPFREAMAWIKEYKKS